MRALLLTLLLCGCIHQQSPTETPTSKELVCKGLSCCWNADKHFAVCSSGGLQEGSIIIRWQE